jgi:carbamoyl-phosphate synthase large subunit
LLEICKKNDIDIIIPASYEFLEPLCENLELFRANNIEPIIPITDPALLKILSHRPTLFEYSTNVLSIPVPEHRTIGTQKMIQEMTHSLGYPLTPILFTPSYYSIGRNIRLVDSSKDMRMLFFNEKPDAVYTTLQQFTEALGNDFPEIIAMEYDCVAEYSVEALCRKGLTFAILAYPSKPISNKLDAHSVLTKDQHFPVIEGIVRRVVEGFGFSYCVGMRIWLDSNGNARLVDITPHLSDDVILCFHGGINFPELMIDMALGEFDYNYRPKIKWGLRMQQVWLELLNYQGDVWKTAL